MAQKDLEALGLSNRTVKALVENSITTPKQLNGTSTDELKAIKGLGPKAIEEIESALRNIDVSAKPADEQQPTAKAGKRSIKGQREASEKAAKEARKRGESTEEEKAPEAKKGPVPMPRPHSERHGKKYREAAKAIDNTKEYELKEAVSLALATSTTSFDATVEVHANLNVDPKQADQNIRETVNMPHGTGKTVRVAVFAPSEDQKKAQEAGADFIGENELLDKLQKEELDFDVLIATPALMSQLGRFAKVLGPKGLMPNPKSGTVTNNVGKAVKEAKAGRVEFRIDKQGIVHVPVGKVSFGEQKIIDNAQAVLDALKGAKPSSIKTQYVASLHITTSMGPSVRIVPAALTSA